MRDDLFDLILHPVRMRIMMALASEPKAAQQLAEELRDVPQATLYRHINKLADADVLEVVEERPVRGTVEKVYALRAGAASLSEEEARNLSKADLLRLFIGFLSTLMDDFTRYLGHSPIIDLAWDGAGFRKIPLNLSDEEFYELNARMNAVFENYVNLTPAPGRTRRLFSTIILPDLESDLGSEE